MGEGSVPGDGGVMETLRSWSKKVHEGGWEEARGVNIMAGAMRELYKGGISA